MAVTEYEVYHKYYISDINECDLDTDNCEHECENTEGSYTCTCPAGYMLHTDGASCTGQNC